MSVSEKRAATAHKLAIAVAKAYYLEDRTKIQIADDFQLSRFKVARLLDYARDSGVVAISIRENPRPEHALAGRLRSALGLADCVVVATAGRESPRAQVAMAGAAYLATSVGPNDVVGFSWGRTLSALTGYLGSLPPIRAIQLNGSLGTDLAISPLEILRRVVQSAGGRADPLMAPLLVDSAEAAAAIRRQPEISNTYAGFRELTVACLSAGSWEPRTSQLVEHMTDEDRAPLKAAGAVGELAGIFLDAEGTPLEYLTDRLIRIPTHELAAVPQKILIAESTVKATIVLAAVRAGLIDVLVIDVALAEELLRLSEEA